MATYGFDAYGRSKYGPYVKIDFGIEPFTSQALDYSRTYLSWREPVGPWDEFVLLRSRSGFATAPDDGQVLYSFTRDDESPPVHTNWLDVSLVGGWYYYTIMLHSTQSDVWEVAGTTSVLVPGDYDSTETLWSYIPEFYKVIRKGQTAGYSEVLFAINPAIYQGGDDQVDNDLLFQFMEVFGWGFDILRSQIETTLSGFDPYTTHSNRLALLADMFGANLPDTVPVQNNRNLIRNLALLYRKRGTAAGLRETLALTTGWDVDVYQWPNMLLSRDQSAFLPIDIQAWDPGTRYVAGDLVRYNNYYRQALQTAYGPEQAPAGTPTSNAYWSVNPFNQNTLFLWNPRTQNTDLTTKMHGWSVQRLDTGLNWLLGVGLGNALSPLSERPEGSLTWQNNSGQPANVLVRSVPGVNNNVTAPPDREDVVKYGIPVPRVTEKWTQKDYHRGDRVLYQGVVYEAKTTTSDIPTEETWKKVGYDSRVRLAPSFYAHGPFTGANLSGGVPIRPWVGFYDEQGARLYEGWVVTEWVPQVLDTFNKPGLVDGTRTPDTSTSLGAVTWSPGAGGPDWAVAADDEGGYAYPTSSALTIRYVVGKQNGNVGITYRRSKTRAIGVYFRGSGSGYWKATQTKLVRVTNTGTETQVGASYEAFKDGDRMVVSFDGSSIVVKKNGASVLSVTDGFNSTADWVGIIAEGI